ncbi:MAG: hypothetical protein ACLFUS_14130, partial [Candidatus Sumerlaeia bacterium]
FVPDRISGWDMPYAKAKTGISMKDQARKRVHFKRLDLTGMSIYHAFLAFVGRNKLGMVKDICPCF